MTDDDWPSGLWDKPWWDKFDALPIDIQGYIIILSKNNDFKLIEITKRLYKIMSEDLIHDEEFKPCYAFAKMARDLTEGYWYERRKK